MKSKYFSPILEVVFKYIFYDDILIGYIGIDPSMNSTGICIIKEDDNMILSEEFVILKPDLCIIKKDGTLKDPLTKREHIAEDSLENFRYIIYKKEDLSQYNDDNIMHEHFKTLNIMKMLHMIESYIYDATKDCEEIYIIQEGISYGSSIRTKSIYDLAGINYLLRSLFIEDKKLFIVTPKTIKKFATGNGNANKDVIIKIFLSTHPEFDKIPKVDDIADSYYMASYARYIKKDRFT